MATLNTLQDLSIPVDRQDLFDMWANAALGKIARSDFADGLEPIVIASEVSDFPSGPAPGEMVFHAAENLLYCYHDEVDNTGVSLWLAIGPDRFETAMLAQEPIAFARAVDLVYDRVCKPADPSVNRPIGFNMGEFNEPISISGPDQAAAVGTSASGAWIPVAIDGVMWAKVENALTSSSSAISTTNDLVCLDEQAGRAESVVPAGNTAFGGLYRNPIGVAFGESTADGSDPEQTPFYFRIILAPREYKAYERDF